jgi:hypothetical protein
VAPAALLVSPEARQRHGGEADAEFLERPTARNRLGHAFGELIELVVHTFPFALVYGSCFCVGVEPGGLAFAYRPTRRAKMLVKLFRSTAVKVATKPLPEPTKLPT